MAILPILAVPFVTLAFLFAQQRLGPRGAGLVGGLPSTLPVILVGTALVAGDQAAGDLALSTAAHIPIQVAFALLFASAIHRVGPAVGLAPAVGAFILLSCGLAQVPLAVGCIAAVPVLVAGPRLMPAADVPSTVAAHTLRTVVLSCVVATVVVATVLAVVSTAGPVTAGALASFPTLSTTLILLLAYRDGTAAGVGALAGFVRGLASFFAFCILVAALAEKVTTPWAVLAGGVASVIVIRAAWLMGGHQDVAIGDPARTAARG